MFIILSTKSTAGLKKKLPSGHLGQEDFSAGQVTVHSHSHLPAGQGIWQGLYGS